MNKYISLIVFVVFSLMYFIFHETYSGMMLVNQYFWGSRPLVYQILLGGVTITGIITGINAIKNIFINKLYFYICLFIILITVFMLYTSSVIFA